MLTYGMVKIHVDAYETKLRRPPVGNEIKAAQNFALFNFK